MATEDDYRYVRERVEAGGFFTTIRPCNDGGFNLVCASRQSEDGNRLSGKSFWVWHSRRNKAWYLVTWAPQYYLIPDTEDPAEVCLRWLTASVDSGSYTPDAIVREFGLREVPEPVFDS